MSHQHTVIAPPGAPATISPATPSPSPSSAVSSPETADDPESLALSPPPITSAGFTALLYVNASSLSLVRHEHTHISMHLHTLTAQKDALLSKLQHTMTTPTPLYTASSYDDDLMHTHGLLTTCNEAASDLAHNWLELHHLRSQRAALLAARAAEIERLQGMIEAGEREEEMLMGMVRQFNRARPLPPARIRYEGIYAGEVEDRMVFCGEVFFERADAERCLVWVRGQMRVWIEEKKQFERARVGESGYGGEAVGDGVEWGEG